jgi:hypothetical protein
MSAPDRQRLSHPSDSTDRLRCPRCEEYLAPELFHRDRGRPNGRSIACKECHRDKVKAGRARPTTRACGGCKIEKPLSSFEGRSFCIECSRATAVRCTAEGCAYIARSHQSLTQHRSILHGIRGGSRGVAVLTAEEQRRLDRLRSVVNKGDRIDTPGLVAMLFGGSAGSTKQVHARGYPRGSFRLPN